MSFDEGELGFVHFVFISQTFLASYVVALCVITHSCKGDLKWFRLLWLTAKLIQGYFGRKSTAAIPKEVIFI